MPDYRRRSWAAALARLNISDDALVADLIESYRRERRARHSPFPDARPVLEYLEPRYELGLVTNGSPAVQRSKVIASGLNRFFGVIVVSGEVGAGKPDSRPFLAALNQLASAPDEAVMVGNTVERDIAGAKSLDMKAILIDRESTTKRPSIADVVVESLSELPGVLLRLQP